MLTTEITSKLTIQTEAQKAQRQQLENSIIGAVLLESHAVSEVIDLLNVRSFTGKRSTIWQAIIHLHQQGQPIDPITVTHHLTKADPTTHWAWEVVSTTATVNSTANIRTHAICLVELSITIQFLQIYTSCEPNNYTVAMAEDILCALSTDADKLKTIEDATKWLQRTIPNADITAKLSQLQKTILSKVDAIRKSERLRTTIHYLEQFSSPLSTQSSRVEIRELIDVLITAINAPKLNTAFTNQVFTLKKLLHD